MPIEAYPCYVRIGESAGTEELVELPTESDGTILLSTIASQYPDAIGLRFKGESGAWRGVRVTDGVLDVPLEGWGDIEYYITKKAAKRKFDEDDGPGSKKTKEEMLSDLIVLGLPYSSTEEDLKTYFEKFGELAHWEVKTDAQTSKSRGFGFVRFTEVDVVEAVLAASHSIGGRKCEVRFPKRESQGNSYGQHDGMPTKLFIGRLPRGATTEDLRDCFSEYGPLKDVYIPNNFRGFGFVTFASQTAAQAVMNSTHILKGSTLNISFPAPKAGEQPHEMMQQQPQYGYGYGGNMHGNNMQQMQQMPPQGGGYGNQGNKMNTGYYTSGYFQSGGKIQGGKTI